MWAENPAHCQLMVTPDQALDLEKFMTKENITGTVIVNDVQAAINNEMAQNAKLQKKTSNARRKPTSRFDYSKFNTWQDVCCTILSF